MIMQLVFSVIMSFIPGIISLYWMPKGMQSDWYSGLAKFPFTPDLYTFDLLWFIFNILLGIGLFFVISGIKETKNTNTAVGLFLVHIVLNSLWTFLLFEKHMMGLSVLIGISVLVVLFFMQKSFTKENKYSGYMVWAYMALVVYSIYLTFGFFILN